MNTMTKLVTDSYDQGVKDTIESVKLGFNALKISLRVDHLTFEEIDGILDSIAEELEDA